MAKRSRSKRKGRSAAFMRSINPFLKAKRSRSRRSVTKSKGVKMARHRRSRSYSRGSSGFLGINMSAAAGAIAYGAARQRISNIILPYTSWIPLGAYADEAGMILLNSVLMKYAFKKEGLARSALRAGTMIEFARIGEQLVSGMSSSSSNGSDQF